MAEKAATAALLNSARKRAQEPFEKVIEGQEKGGEYFTHQKVNYYTFKTDMQECMLDLVKPCLERQLEDREKNKELQFAHNRLSKRIQ